MLLEQAPIVDKECEISRDQLRRNGRVQNLLAPLGFLSRWSFCCLRFRKLVRNDAANRD